MLSEVSFGSAAPAEWEGGKTAAAIRPPPCPAPTLHTLQHCSPPDPWGLQGCSSVSPPLEHPLQDHKDIGCCRAEG